jgi:hypothetical protein
LFSFIIDLKCANLFDVSTVSMSICRKSLETEKGRYAIERRVWLRGAETRGFKKLAASEGNNTIEPQMRSLKKSKSQEENDKEVERKSDSTCVSPDKHS